MARKARGTGAKEQELQLLEALRFIKAAQSEGGKATYQKHCKFIRDGGGQAFVVAFDGILSAGHPIYEEMAGCPNTFRLIDALTRVRGAYSLTLLDNQRLSISSGAYRAVVPCEDPAMIDPMLGDPKQWTIDDRWKVAAVRAGSFCTDGAQTVMGASVITYGASLVGTNGTAIVEANHGWQMPPGLIIPMSFVQAVAKVDAKVQGFGFSNDSLTVHFENGAWLRTQLYQEAYPNVDRILSALDMRNMTDVPEGFFDAVSAVVSFSDTSSIIVDVDQVRSHFDTNIGAQHQCPGLPYEQLCINGGHLLKLKPFMTKIDFASYTDKVLLSGEDVRAVLIRMTR